MKSQYALLIGMGADLPVTIDDALGLREVLTDPQRCGFDPANVTALTGPGATRSHILDALDELVRVVEAESTVVIFFSGHGLAIPGPNQTSATYLIPFGFDSSNPTGTAISDEEFARALKRLRSKNILVLLDCCHARGIGADAVKAPGTTPPSPGLVSVALPPSVKQMATADAADGSGRVVISGSMASEYSLTSQPYSLFTRAIIGALCGEQYKHKQPDSEFVTTSDIAGYAREMVPRWSKNRQTPQYDHNNASNFVVGTYAAGTKSPVPVPWPEPEPETVAQENAERLAPRAGHTGTVHGGGALAQGDGALAQGDGAVAVGHGGVFVGGNNEGNIVTGSQTVHGGMSFGGGARTVVSGGTNVAIGTSGPVAQTSAVGEQPSISDLLKQLASIQAALAKLPPAQPDVADARTSVAEAMTAAGKPQPDGQKTGNRLGELMTTIERAGTVLAGVLPLAKTAVELAHKLFGG